MLIKWKIGRRDEIGRRAAERRRADHDRAPLGAAAEGAVGVGSAPARPAMRRIEHSVWLEATPEAAHYCMTTARRNFALILSCKPPMKKRPLTIGATEFRAKCLELMDHVHQLKCNSIVITKRGKPRVKIVPVDQPATPLRGSMKGTVKVLGDLTESLQEKWDATPTC